MGGHKKKTEKKPKTLENVYGKLSILHGMSSDLNLTNEHHLFCMASHILADSHFQMSDLSLDSKKFQSLHKECNEMGFKFSMASKKSPKATSKGMKKSSYY